MPVADGSAAFTDTNVLDTHTATWSWGDGTSTGTVTEANGSGTITGSHSYTTAGVYTIQVTVTDNHGASSQATFEFVVVYDPNGGFITGGGRITSPPSSLSRMACNVWPRCPAGDRHPVRFWTWRPAMRKAPGRNRWRSALALTTVRDYHDHVITTSVADAKARLSELLRLVGQGETVVILHRGRPVARLVAPEREVGRQTRLLELERRGVIRRGSMAPDATLLDDDAPRLAAASSLLSALLEDRAAGR